MRKESLESLFEFSIIVAVFLCITSAYANQGSIIALDTGSVSRTRFVAVEGGAEHSLALRTDGSLVAWGRNNYGQCDVPSGTNYVAIAAGGWHNLALKSDGSIVAWGNNDNGRSNAPPGNYIAIAAGGGHSLAIKSDGSLAAWGMNETGQCNVPAGADFKAIAAGWEHCLALKSDGSIVAWGANSWGQCNVPAGNDYIAIAAGYNHSLALKSDGSIVAWGLNDYGQCNVPSGRNFKAIAADGSHNLAQKSDGSLVAWGLNSDGQCNVPAGSDFIAIAAGARHSLALKSNGSLIVWGFNYFGQANVPSDTPVALQNLDTTCFAEWLDGAEQPITNVSGPDYVLWTQISQLGYSGLVYGDSLNSGWRHLRIGFKTPVQVGTVLVLGNGQLSVLKPDAVYPGNLNNDDDWIAAERLTTDNTISLDEHPFSDPISKESIKDGLTPYDKYKTRITAWVLLPGTSTRALRFSHYVEPYNPSVICNYDPERTSYYSAWLGGVYVMAQRFSNIAPQAIAITSSGQTWAARINNSVSNIWSAWDNSKSGNPLWTGSDHVVSDDNPEWVMLVWPTEVLCSGITTCLTGFGMAEVQAYVGPANLHPREAPESAWQTITNFIGNRPPALSAGCNTLNLVWWEFPATITTRALRLHITKAWDEKLLDVGGDWTKDGKRVWLGEWMCWFPLGESPLNDSIVAHPEDSHPPIPVSFTLDEPGIVTLVIEDANGNRVRNLVSETPFPAGTNVVWWDGFDDRGVLTVDGIGNIHFDDVLCMNYGNYGVNQIQRRLVEPGTYQVRGLVRKPIDLSYELTVYNAGNPPWNTSDRTGMWLTDHSPPEDVIFLPTPTPRVLIASLCSESGDGLVWTDLKGQKLKGRHSVNEGWSGASHLARDIGTEPVPGVDVYIGSSYGEIRLHSICNYNLHTILIWQFPDQSQEGLGGLAVFNGRIVANLNKMSQLMFVDAATGQVEGFAPLADARGLIFDPQGRLLALVGNRLLRYNLDANSIVLPSPEVLASGLDDPRYVTLDNYGNFYVSQHGSSNQVRVFTNTGAFVRDIGTRGIPQAGPYDPTQMHNPNGLTVTPDGHLWVAETDFGPKRVSIWNLDGTFVKALYGPSQYGGGGELDPADKSRFYYFNYVGMEFLLDWTNGTSELVNIYYRPDPDDLKLPAEVGESGGPQTPIYLNGRTYMVNAFNCSAGGARRPGAGIWLTRDGRPIPVATIGVTRHTGGGGVPIEWDVIAKEPFASLVPEGVWTFSWCDLNDDAHLQANELQFAPENPGLITINGKLEICTSAAKVFSPVGFTTGGAPIYNLTQGQLMIEGFFLNEAGTSCQVLPIADGWTFTTGGPLRGIRNGEVVWTYPNPRPSLGAAHWPKESPLPSYPGQLIGTMRLLGLPITVPGSDAGEIMAINGNYGNIYLITTDGLFVATLFKDFRAAPLWSMPQDERGILLNDVTLEDECFWPFIKVTPDGNVYLTAGKNYSSIVRVDGLDSIRRFTAPNVIVTSELITQASEYPFQHEAERIAVEGRDVLTVDALKTPPVVDGLLDEWTNIDWVVLDDRCSAAVAVSQGRLYVALKTDDSRLLQNSADSLLSMAWSGGALDLMLGTDPDADPHRTAPIAGDLRLLVAQVDGVTKAVLYRPIVPGSTDPLLVSTTWQTNYIDRVDDVSPYIQLRRTLNDYECSVPLALLGLEPRLGQTVLGDIGILRGYNLSDAKINWAPSGYIRSTVQWAYWHNKITGVLFDEVSGTKLWPWVWGCWQFTPSVLNQLSAINTPPILWPTADQTVRVGETLTLNLGVAQGLFRELFMPMENMPWPANFPDNPVSAEVWPYGFQMPSNIGEWYGQRVRGYLVPPMTGEYTFWIKGDDEVFLFLSENESPIYKEQIAHAMYWYDMSAPIHLQASQRYYIEAMMQEALNEDYLTAYWQMPDGTIEDPIPACRFIPFGIAAMYPDTDWPPQTLKFSLGPGAPAGAVIDPKTGVFSWTTGEEHGGADYLVTIKVSDDGVPSLSSETTLKIIVNSIP